MIAHDPDDSALDHDTGLVGRVREKDQIASLLGDLSLRSGTDIKAKRKRATRAVRNSRRPSPPWG
ncbi:hypothetical protein GCM10010121_045960 [Streptomyces brasiliensis]|uniref:Uncharacterized protein n=1 Tax=Streptomyces brasiliensis TaxID=1954 RepID=A0A917KVN7_9ACTN|nr:hypothetical protein GCM10010121_045960 [Streptomyces brasiliensis]